MANVSEVFRTVRALGLSVRRVEGEWRIARKGRLCGACRKAGGIALGRLATLHLGGCPEAAAYYTTDNQDAIDTARAMVRANG